MQIAKYIEMKRCFIMQIGVCCIRWIAVDIELLGTRIAFRGPHIVLRGPALGSGGPIMYIVPGPPNLYFNHCLWLTRMSQELILTTI